MGYTRYYTLCNNKDYLVHILHLILHHNTSEYEDVGEPLKRVKYADIPESMKTLAGKQKKYARFKHAQYIITYDNEGGRNSTRPFFEHRNVDPDAQYNMPPKAVGMIDDPANGDMDWKIVTPSNINIYREGGLESLNNCIRRHIETLAI